MNIRTVPAFYFSKENFEAASKSYESMIKTLSPEEKMARLPVKQVMIPVERLVFLSYPDDLKKPLATILKDHDFIKFNRFSVFTSQYHLFKMIHRSVITLFVSRKLIEKDIVFDIHTFTLEEMLNEALSDIKELLDRGFAFVSATGNLLDAKRSMDAARECKDVFITESGMANEPVMGLITNNMLLDYAKV